MDKTLHLNLKRKWFDMIKSGVKKEEYREQKDYWGKRLIANYEQLDIDGEGLVWFKDFDSITFSNGYSKDRDQFEIELNRITAGEGSPDWGAIPGKNYFVLELGEII